MQHPKDLLIANFSYDLPDEKVAKYPLAARDASKLLLYDKGAISESVFGKIAHHLPANALLVFNNSRVIQSRLSFTKPSGGAIEIFILEPCAEYGDMATAMKNTGHITCNCLVGGAKKWKQGKLEMVLTNNVEPVILTAEMISRKGEEFIIAFNWQPEVGFATALEIFGNTPIPPYLHRQSEAADKDRYQTIYAKENGSVAAPTAGLHFTDEVMQSLHAKNIEHTYVTLHVGAGTFKPVKSDTIAGHEMHEEYMVVDTLLIEKLMSHEKIIPVGTTSMRTIETLYWMGVKTLVNSSIALAALEIKQWEVYDDLMHHNISKNAAMQALLNWLKKSNLESLSLRTQILIAPGYKPKIATGLITNFHQPQSTLLLLIAALAGDDWKKIYSYGLENEFRFLSYGDSSLISW